MVSPIIIAMYAIAFVMFAYRCIRFKRRIEPLAFFIALAIGAVLFYFEAPVSIVLLLMSGIVLFNGLLFSYGSRIFYAYFAVAAAYLVGFSVYGVAVPLLAQTMLIGIISEMYRFGFAPNRVSDKRKETNRDLVQIGIGIGLLLIYYFLDLGRADLFLIGLIMLGLLFASLAMTFSRLGIAKKLYAMERDYTTFGHGAVWLALGILVAVSLIMQKPYVMVVIAAIFFGDSLATIIGVRLSRPKLPYNKRKSVAGTVAYFLITAAVAYVFVGWIAIVLALIAAIVESLPVRVDDNVTVSFVLVAAVTVLRYAMLA